MLETHFSFFSFWSRCTGTPRYFTWVAQGMPAIVGDDVLSQYLWLGLVKPQVPGATQVIQFLDGLRHLGLGVGQDEHVVGEG